jgi:DNA protecting protein DprA
MMTCPSERTLLRYLVVSDALENSYREAKRLILGTFKSIDALWDAALAGDERIPESVRRAIASEDYAGAESVMADLEQIGAKAVTLENSLYPENLREISAPPPILYYKGSLAKLSRRGLAIVGTVDVSDEGVRRAHKLARLCTEHRIQVISGLAKGVDTAAHQAALDFSGPTFGVVGHGLMQVYPPENAALFERVADAGAVISQFKPRFRARRWSFPVRNETMCAIANGTVIVEAHEKCGSIIQARFSFKHRKFVFVLASNDRPENAHWVEPLKLEGAVTVRTFDDIVERLKPLYAEFRDEPTSSSGSPTAEEEPRRSESVRTILFDLDGVLFDAAPCLADAYVDVAKTLGRVVEAAELSPLLGHAPPYVFTRLGLNGPDGNRIFRSVYAARVGKNPRFFTDFLPEVAALKREGVKIGVVTSNTRSRYEAIMGGSPWKALIDVSVTWNDVRKEDRKPAPGCLLRALEAVDGSPENSIYVGDAVADVQAAEQAGMQSLAVGWGGIHDEVALRAARPTAFVAEPPGFGEVLRRLLAH